MHTCERLPPPRAGPCGTADTSVDRRVGVVPSPCLVLRLQLLIRTSTIWSWWRFPSSLRWVVFPQGWGCLHLVGVMYGAICVGPVVVFLDISSVSFGILENSWIELFCGIMFWPLPAGGKAAPPFHICYGWIKSSSQATVENAAISVFFWITQKTILGLSV